MGRYREIAARLMSDPVANADYLAFPVWFDLMWGSAGEVPLLGEFLTELELRLDGFEEPEIMATLRSTSIWLEEKNREESFEPTIFDELRQMISGGE